MPRRKLLVVLILASLAAVAAVPAGAQAKRAVRGVGYKTYVPSGWKVKHRTVKHGWNEVLASPTGRPSDELSVNMNTINARTLAKTLKVKALPAAPTDLVQMLPTIPPGASQARATAPASTMTLGGSLGAQTGYHYVTAAGEGISASTIVARRGNRVFLLNIAGDDQLSLLAESAVGLVSSSWSWT